jgi:hypothetical protein
MEGYGCGSERLKKLTGLTDQDAEHWWGKSSKIVKFLKAARSEGEELEQEWARVEAERDNMSDSGTITSVINI